MLALTDLMEMRGIDQAWIKSKAGWIAPVFALPFVAGGVLVQAGSYGTATAQIGFPRLGFHWPTLVVVLAVASVEYLLRKGLRRGWVADPVEAAAQQSEPPATPNGG